VSVKILVADDERALVDAVAGFLEDEGYHVTVARDGLTAIEIALRQSPALVLSDVHMPHLDGFAFVRRLRAVGCAMPIVLMSAVYRQIDILGVHFIAKPFDLDHLLDVIHLALGDGHTS
jgi:DNA-binding response OmpR family regulator